MNTILILFLSVASTVRAGYGQVDYCTDAGMTRYALEGDLREMQDCLFYLETPPDLTTDMLVAASCRGQYDVVDWLLGEGIKVHPNRDDIQCAAGLGYTGIVKLLLKADSTYLGRPFVFAAANGHIGVVNALLKAGADPNESIHCYYKIKYAPMRLYDGLKGSVLTCEALADKLNGKYADTNDHGCSKHEYTRLDPYADDWDITGVGEDEYEGVQ